jgi:probable HAF family extracellular repeat protein
VPAVIAMLAIPGRATAHHQESGQYPYILIDLGTFGGPQAGHGNFAPGAFTGDGAIVGTADTATRYPYSPKGNPAFNGDRYVQHTFIWRKGVLTDLGALGSQPGKNSSYPNWANARGDAAGISEDGIIDPHTKYPEAHATLWKDGRIIDLGTLGGNESQAFGMNNRDQVVGLAENGIPDATSMLGTGIQTRAFLWQDGRMRDLGTLGGPDSFAWWINDRGQIAGVSYTDAKKNPVTGQPTTHPFLWQGGRMRDLGTLGGSVGTFGGVNAINNRGEVVGASNLKGDKKSHPFLWAGQNLRDLGTLGGDNGAAFWMNDAGEVVGSANLAIPCPGCGEPQVYHPFLWKDGQMTDLGVVPGDKCGRAFGINARGQVVGATGICHGGVHAFLWQHGSMVDLNNLVAPSKLRLTVAWTINDQGDIAGEAALPNGNQRDFLMVPANPPTS